MRSDATTRTADYHRSARPGTPAERFWHVAIPPRPGVYEREDKGFAGRAIRKCIILNGFRSLVRPPGSSRQDWVRDAPRSFAPLRMTSCLLDDTPPLGLTFCFVSGLGEINQPKRGSEWLMVAEKSLSVKVNLGCGRL